MVTLDELLTVPKFEGLRLINTHADLSLEVANLDITENNDIKHFTSENALILTTGTLFQDQQAGLKKLIKDLSDIQSPGLCIKVSRFLHHIDQDIIDYADQLNFPLVEIPSNWNLGELAREISSYVSEDVTGKLYYALNIQQELNQLLIKGVTIDKIIERMSKLLGVPIILFSPFKDVTAYSSHYKHDPTLLHQHERYFYRDYDDTLSYDNDTAIFEQQSHLIFKVQPYAYFPYYLMVSKVDRLSYPFSLLTIEQLVSILSFGLYKNAKIKEVEQNDINRFFESLMVRESDNFLSVKKHPELFMQYGIYHSDYYQMVICVIDEEDTLENSIYLSERLHLTYQWLKSVLTHIDHRISVYKLPSNDRFAILFQNRHTYYLDYLRRIQKDYPNYFEGSISFGVGNEISDFSQLPHSFFEANEAYEAMADKHEKQFLEFYRSKNISELLELIPQEKLQPFVQHTLGSLSYPKNKKDLELKQTLRIFMDNQCDITKTAEKIFIHRNTVKYRINKCKEIIGKDIDSAEHSLNIRMALYASELHTRDTP